MSNSRQTERLLWPSPRTRRRISVQVSMSVYTHRPHGEGPGWGERNPHPGPSPASQAMGATFSDRPSVPGPRHVFRAAVTAGEGLSSTEAMESLRKAVPPDIGSVGYSFD